jgi:hypothetical protein
MGRVIECNQAFQSIMISDSDDYLFNALEMSWLERTYGEYSGIISATLQSLLIPGRGCNIHNTPLQ